MRWMVILTIGGGVIAAPLVGQAAVARSHLVALQADLEKNGDAAVVTKDLVVKYSQRIDSVGSCVLWLSVQEDSPNLSQRNVFELRLNRLTPDVITKPWPAYDLHLVRLETTSGQDEISAPRINGDETVPTPHQWWFTEVVFSDSVDARVAANHLSSAIRVCGGQKRTVAVARAIAARESRPTKSDSLLGDHLTPQQKKFVIGACQDRIRAQLTAPSSARFEADPMISGSDGGLLILGKVEAQNGAGGFRFVDYLCSFELYGKKYIPKNASILNSDP